MTRSHEFLQYWFFDRRRAQAWMYVWVFSVFMYVEAMCRSPIQGVPLSLYKQYTII